MKRVLAIGLLGITWMGAGVFLLYKGIFLLVEAITFGDPKNQTILKFLKGSAVSQDQAAILLLCFALILGMAKGRLVLAKAARKTVSKILQTPEPIKVTEVFSFKFLALILLMMSFGILINRSGLSYDIRSLIDVAVGSALIQGAVQYLRSAVQVRLYGKKIL